MIEPNFVNYFLFRWSWFVLNVLLLVFGCYFLLIFGFGFPIYFDKTVVNSSNVKGLSFFGWRRLNKAEFSGYKLGNFVLNWHRTGAGNYCVSVGRNFWLKIKCPVRLFNAQLESPALGFYLSLLRRPRLSSLRFLVLLNRQAPMSGLFFCSVQEAQPITSPSLKPFIAVAAVYGGQACCFLLASKPKLSEMCSRPNYLLLFALGLGSIAVFITVWKAHSMGLIVCGLKARFSYAQMVLCCIVMLEKDIIPTRIFNFSRHSMVFTFVGPRSMFRVPKCYGGVCPSKKYM